MRKLLIALALVALPALTACTIQPSDPATPVAGHVLKGAVSQTLNPVPGLADLWSINSTPAAATQATATKAASSPVTNKHVATAIYASFSAGATAGTPLNVNLRDGGTGAGTILYSGALSVPANTANGLAITGLTIPGTAGNAMTIEFSAAGAAATVQTVTLLGYDTAP